jgi:hypothetical protein
MFAVAAASKLADRDGARRAIAAVGVPRRTAAVVGWGLACAEFAVALALLAGVWLAGRATGYSAVAATVALVMLTGFSAVVLASLARGRALECHCFGRLSSGPAGWSTLARNAFFAALAVFVALHGHFGGPLAAIAIAMLALWLGPALYARWTARPGAPAADLALPDRAGHIWTLDRLQEDRRPLVLVFSQPGCGACDALLPEVLGWQRDLPGRITVAVINAGAASDAVPLELVDERRAAFAAYHITATPSAVLIDAGRRLDAASGAGPIRELVDRAVRLSTQSTFTRRGLLRRASAGLASAGVLPVAAACAADHPSNAKALQVEDVWMCDQTFALCTTAPCVPSPTDPTISVCDCVVVNGNSIGSKNCTDRAQSGSKIRSAFSTVNINTNFAVLSCPSAAPWANCLDVECEIDPRNPARAKCQCVTVKTGPSITFGGGCDTATCTSTILSAASPEMYQAGMRQLRTAMDRVGKPVTFPPPCPAK